MVDLDDVQVRASGVFVEALERGDLEAVERALIIVFAVANLRLAESDGGEA